MNTYTKSAELSSVPFYEIRRSAIGSLNNDSTLKSGLTLN